MGDGANELAVLDDGAAAHVCVKLRTTLFYEFILNLYDFDSIYILFQCTDHSLMTRALLGRSSNSMPTGFVPWAFYA